MEASAKVLNAQFLDKMKTEDGKTKIASKGADFIQDRMREDGFIGSIIPWTTVGREDLQVSVQHDTMVKIVQSDIATRAMTMSFRGSPRVQYISAPRFEVPFYRIGSQRYAYTEMEIMAYDVPITKFVMDRIANDMSEIEDRQGLTICESACQAMQKEANAVAYTSKFADDKACSAYNVLNTAGFVEKGKVKGVDVLQNTTAGSVAAGLDETLRFALQKDDLTKLAKLFPGTGVGKGSRLSMGLCLMTDTDFEDLNTWTLSDVGEKIIGETTVDGFKYKTLLGRKFSRTLKTDILRPGNLYAFTDPKFIGGAMRLGKSGFFADVERDNHTFEGWENCVIYIGNCAAVRKLELFAGSVDSIGDPADNATCLDLYTPVAEEKLGRLNNLVAEGVTFPRVAQF